MLTKSLATPSDLQFRVLLPSVCLSVFRAFPQSGPDPAQIGFEAISVPTRSICSKLLSISFHETTTRGLRQEKKKKKQTAQKNKPDTNRDWTKSVAHLQTERDVPCSKERPLWLQGHVPKALACNCLCVCVSVSLSARMCTCMFSYVVHTAIPSTPHKRRCCTPSQKSKYSF